MPCPIRRANFSMVLCAARADAVRPYMRLGRMVHILGTLAVSKGHPCGVHNLYPNRMVRGAHPTCGVRPLRHSGQGGRRPPLHALRVHGTYPGYPCGVLKDTLAVSKGHPCGVHTLYPNRMVRGAHPTCGVRPLRHSGQGGRRPPLHALGAHGAHPVYPAVS